MSFESTELPEGLKEIALYFAQLANKAATLEQLLQENGLTMEEMSQWNETKAFQTYLASLRHLSFKDNVGKVDFSLFRKSIEGNAPHMKQFYELLSEFQAQGGSLQQMQSLRIIFEQLEALSQHRFESA
jgi:hypothetical protein